MIKIADIKVDYINHMGDDLSVVNAARVSFDKESDWEYYKESGCSTGEIQGLKASDVGLIKYLAKHKHFSPFNHTFITVRVKAPVFVARQTVKHKFMPINEVSRRYVDSEPEFYVPKDWRAKAENVKQGSSDELVNGIMFINNDENGDNHGDMFDAAEYSTQVALDIYKGMLAKGVCAEMARSVLPQNMMTTFYWSGTLGAFADMLRLRMDSHTQAETRIVAEKIRDIIEPLFPVSLKALLNNG